MKRLKKQITAVHDNDLEEFLNRLGILSDLTEGRISCWSCNKIVSLDTLSAVFPDGSTIAVACDEPSCYERILEKRR